MLEFEVTIKRVTVSEPKNKLAKMLMVGGTKHEDLIYLQTVPELDIAKVIATVNLSLKKREDSNANN